MKWLRFPFSLSAAKKRRSMTVAFVLALPIFPVENLLYLSCYLVMLLAYDIRLEDT